MRTHGTSASHSHIDMRRRNRAAPEDRDDDTGDDVEEELAAKPPFPPAGACTAKSVTLAYALWFLAPPLGLHHAYLGNGAQMLRHASFLGIGGLGCVCDAFFIPVYCRPTFALPSFAFWTRVLLFTSLYSALVPSFFPPEEYGWFGMDWSARQAMGTALVARPLGAAFGAWLASDPLRGGSITRAAVVATPLSVGASYLVGEVAQFSNRSAAPTMAAIGGAVGGVYWHRHGGGGIDAMLVRPAPSTAYRVAKGGVALVGAASTWAVGLLGVYQHAFVFSYAKGEYVRVLNKVNGVMMNDDEWTDLAGRLSAARRAFLTGEGGWSRALPRAIQAFDRTGEGAACAALGVPRGAWTMAQIKKVHRGLARRFHPDKLVGLTPAERAGADLEFKRMQAAYEHLLRLNRIWSGGRAADAHDEEREEETPTAETVF